MHHSLSHARPLALAAVVVAVACGAPAGPRQPLSVRSADRSLLCGQLADRFVGLPASPSGTEPSGGPAPSSGSLWIRTCSAIPQGEELRVRLMGAGWYWVDVKDGLFAVRQQVPFDLSLELSCRIHASSAAGVLSVWFEPTREPTVSVRARQALDVRNRNAWGAMVRLLPFLPVSSGAAQRFDEKAAATFRDKLLAGATLTYDVQTGQADAALNRLVGGETPAHPYGNGALGRQ